jgi:hypothetical protein
MPRSYLAPDAQNLAKSRGPLRQVFVAGVAFAARGTSTRASKAPEITLQKSPNGRIFDT